MLIKIVFCDVAERYQMGIQDPASSIVEGMIFFHDYLIAFLILIAVPVFWVLFKVIYTFDHKWSLKPEKFTHSSFLEIIWTLIPAIILGFIGVPSFNLLYALENKKTLEMTIKIVGHQWYWSYEYFYFWLSSASDFNSLSSLKKILFDSYLQIELPLFGSFRLLETDKQVVLPAKTFINLLVTAADVLHSWAVPALGVKIDACPGRISQGSIFIKREGHFYGQCSEICGVNHGFMPIVTSVVDNLNFVKWIIDEA